MRRKLLAQIECSITTNVADTLREENAFEDWTRRAQLEVANVNYQVDQNSLSPREHAELLKMIGRLDLAVAIAPELAPELPTGFFAIAIGTFANSYKFCSCQFCGTVIRRNKPGAARHRKACAGWIREYAPTDCGHKFTTPGCASCASKPLRFPTHAEFPCQPVGSCSCESGFDNGSE